MTDETPEPKKAKAPLRPRADGPNAELAKRRAERMARGSTDHSFDKRLPTEGALLDHNNYKYRWVNDEPGRIQRLQGMEYELVSDEEMNGLQNAHHVGLSREGRPMNARLMKKWKPWFDEDQDRKNAESRELETALKRGKHPQQMDAKDGAEADKFYAKTNNQITAATPTKSAGGYTP